MGYRTQASSPLAIANAGFRLLTTGPQPLSVDGEQIGGLPGRWIPLNELQRLLLRSAPATQDAAWKVLVTRARNEPSWVIGTVGVAMPGLRRAAGVLARGYGGDTADVDAEILVGFLEALRTVDLERRAIALRLRWAAYRAGASFRRADSTPGGRHELPVWAAVPPRLLGHPDFVLADAVAQGVVSASEAALISDTRLDRRPLTDVAHHLQVTYDSARMRRSRAESRVVRAIRDGQVASRVFG
jgi:hypothetical protein